MRRVHKVTACRSCGSQVASRFQDLRQQASDMFIEPQDLTTVSHAHEQKGNPAALTELLDACTAPRYATVVTLAGLMGVRRGFSHKGKLSGQSAPARA